MKKFSKSACAECTLYLVLLSVDDEEYEHHEVLLVAAQVGPILSSRDAVEYNQVLGGAHIAKVCPVRDLKFNVLLQILLTFFSRSRMRSWLRKQL